MIEINSAKSANFPNGKETEIDFFADLIIQNCEKYNYFDLYDVVYHCNLGNEKESQFREIYFEVLNILKLKKLIENENGYSSVFKLRKEGIEAKELGGYFKYIEFLKTKETEKDKRTIITKNYIGGDNYGFQLSESDLNNPAIQNANKITAHKNPKKSFLEIASWVFGIVIAVIAIYEFLIK